VARRIGEREEWVAYFAASALGLLRQQFLLFRHWRPLFQSLGQRIGLPLDSLLASRSKERATRYEVRLKALPTVETRALQDLARQLSDAGIPLVLFSAPTQELTRLTVPGETVPAAHEIQARVEEHLTDLAEVEGFVFVPHSAFDGYSPSVFRDAIRLEKDETSRFTTQLSTLMNGDR